MADSRPTEPDVFDHLAAATRATLSKKKRRRLAAELRAIADAIRPRAVDYGNLYPINGGGLTVAEHPTARARLARVDAMERYAAQILEVRR